MSYAPQQERETEQIIGVITSVVHKGEDKFQAVVQPDGSQYTKNLWTKDQQLISYLSSQVGNRLGFACNVSHWNLQDGTPVRSLWIDQVGPVAPGSPALQGPPQPVPPPQQPWDAAHQAQQATMVQPQPSNAISPEMAASLRAAGAVPFEQPQQDQREQRIHRQTAAKVAALLLGYMEENQRNLATLFIVSERLVSYFNDGLPQAETLDQLMERAMPQDVEGPPPDDSDIPF